MYATSPYASTADNIYMTPTVHSTNFYPVTDNLFHQYRSYYPEYHHHSPASASAYVTNGFLSYDSYATGITQTKEEKWQDNEKYYSLTAQHQHERINSNNVNTNYSGYGSSPTAAGGPAQHVNIKCYL